MIGRSTVAVISTIILLLNCCAQLTGDDAVGDSSGGPVIIEEQPSTNENKGNGNGNTASLSNTRRTNNIIDGGTSKSHETSKRPRVTLLGLDDLLNLERSGIVGLGSDFNRDTSDQDADIPSRLNYNQLHADDMIEDSIYDPFSADISCIEENNEEDGGSGANCWRPPDSTVEEEIIQVSSDCEDSTSMSAGLETLAWGYGGIDPDDGIHEGKREVEQNNSAGGIGETKTTEHKEQQCKASTEVLVSPKIEKDVASRQCEATKSKFVDKHWGSDVNILKMRDQLRGRRGKYWNMEDTVEAPSRESKTVPSSEIESGKKKPGSTAKDRRPPVFLMPGLASTRLVSWKHKPCPQNPLLSDIKMLDYVWLNMNLLLQMATIDARCWNECMTLGKYQSDYDGADDGDNDEVSKARGCKLRPDEGLDSISSLAPGSISSNFLVGGTNTVYAWLIQWLADNLGYDVTSIVALPYDWRLSPEKMESR